MLCPKCGSELEKGVEICAKCGEIQNNRLQEIENVSSVLSQNKNSNLPIKLLTIGAGLALIIFLIACIAGGTVPFFNGITMLGWFVSIALVGVGIALSVRSFKRRNKTEIKLQMIAIVPVIAFIALLIVCSSVINKKAEFFDSALSSKSDDVQSYMSEYELTELAEQAAERALYDELRSEAERFRFNADLTKYDIATIEPNSSSQYSHTVYGKVLCYNNYGEFVGTATFNIPVDVDENGNTKTDDVNFVWNFF